MSNRIDPRDLMKLPLEDRHEILRLQAERIAYGEYIRCAELDVCVQCYASAPEPDIQGGHCPRCRQLAELEREIGRAVIDAGVIFHSTNPDIDALIARWRKLHAEPRHNSPL